MEKEKKYVFLNNFMYALQIAKKSNKKLLAVILIKPMANIVTKLMWAYSPKLVLSFIEQNLELNKIIFNIIIVCTVILIFNIISTISNNAFDYEYRITEGYLEKLRMNKIFHTDFKNMESPEFLDFAQKAKTALYRGRGFFGVLFESRNFIAQGVLMIISATLIGIQNVFVMIFFIIISFGIAKILVFFTKLDKKKFTDKMAPVWRKMTYLEGVTKNFDFAKDIRIFSMSDIFDRELNSTNDIFNKLNKKHHNRWIICSMDMELVLLMQKTLMYVWLVYNVIQGNYQISDFILYVGLVITFHDSVGYVNWIFSNIRGNCLLINDYRNFLNWEESKKNIVENEKKQSVHDGNYSFEFQNVSFKYPGHDIYALKNINLKINAGEKLAIVGVNGAGKTTLVKLIMKLYEPTQGRILLNGVDIKEYNREEYFKLFSPIFQNVECFAMTIYENISFEEEKNTDMDKVGKVLEQSGLKTKIDCYDKDVHSNLLKIFDKEGIDLSGGEKQRLAMARAMYKGGEVIILDEPTAALDALAEDKMYREFDNMIQGKTAIFISHRLGSTRFCDKIAMFDGGEIVEEGTHDELIAKNGKYAYMYEVQSQYYKDKKEMDGGQYDEK